MKEFGALFQSADWKNEKHAPAIEVGAADAAGWLPVTVAVGKEIAHPNTTAHHIAWIEVFFQATGEKFPYHVGRFEFQAHGASTEGADTSTIYTQPRASFAFKTGKAGTLYAFSYCNIHGLWASASEVAV